MKILLATNFSDSAHKALHFAQHLQAVYEAEVHLIHVVHHTWWLWFGTTKKLNEIHQRLSDWQALLGEQDSSHIYVEKGHVADQIIHKADWIQADLILIGNKTQSSGRYKSAATMESIVRHTNRDVLITKNEKAHKILCGIDGSETSMRALKQAVRYATHLNAELHLIHALPSADFNPLGLSDEAIKGKEQAFLESRQAELEQTIANHVEREAFETCRFHWGKPAESILNQSEDQEFDLVVIGAKGHSTLYNIFIGSTAEKVVRHVPCSLLVIH